MSTPPPTPREPATLVWHRGRGVAIVTDTHIWTIPSISRRPPNDPLRRLINAKTAEAQAVLQGHQPGPYNDQAATARALAHIHHTRRRTTHRSGPSPTR